MKKIFCLLCILLFPVFVLAAESIDINTATLSQLDKITTIGPALAQRIVDGRPFSSVDDLKRVKGIGPATLQKIKNQGFACVNCQTTETALIADTSKTEAEKNKTVVVPEQPAVNYPTGIFINEILPSPKGSDETDEWIELYNSNNFTVDLSDWQIQDVTGTVSTYTILKDTKISAFAFLVFKRPDTKIMLNNDQDGLKLLNPDKKISDSVSFTKAPIGQSYNKTDSGWKWSQTLTPGSKNIITANSVAVKKTLPKNNNSVKNNVEESGLADISQTTDTNQDNKTSNPWFLFFTALAATLVLASIVLLIKLKLKKNVRT